MYEQQIKVGVSGLETAEKAVSTTAALEDRTRRLAQVIADRLAGDEKLLGKQLDLIKAETILEGLREKHRMQTEALAASTNKQAAAQEALNTASRKTVTDVQAASAAIRAMEGTLSIRAVEQFTTKLLGMGPAMQALFPLVGGIAFLELLDKGATKLGIHLDFWNDISRVQQESNKNLREAGAEYGRLLEQLKEIQKQERRRSLIARDPKNGAMAADSADATDTQELAASNVRVNQLRAQRDSLQRLSALKVRQEDTFARINSEQPGRIQAGDVMHSELLGVENVEQAKIRLRDITAQLRAAEQEQFNLRKQMSSAAAKVDDDVAKKREEAARKAAAIEEHILEIRKRADEISARAFFGNSLEGKRAYEQVRLRTEEADAIRRYGNTPSEALRIRGSFTLMRAAAYGANTDAITRRDMDEGNSLDAVSRESTAKLIRTDLANERRDSPEMRALMGVGMPAIPGGYRSPGQDLRDVKDSERRYMSLARVTGQLGGMSEGDQIASQSAARIRFAKLEYDAQLRVNEAKLHGTEKEIADADALDQKRQKIFDAQMERDQAVLEIALRQKETFQNTVVGFLRAARSGNAGGFLRGQAEGLGDKVISNAAGMLWPMIQKATGGMHAADGTFLGGLLKGTPFGPDPTKAAQQDNTLATRANTEATNSLTAALTGGTVASGPGVAGVAAGSGAGASLPAAISGISKTLGTIAKYGGAAFGAYGGISALSKGGTRSTVSGIGELAGAAALIDPEPISKAVLGIVAGATALVSGFLGDPRANRSSAIQQTLKTNQFMEPVSIAASMTTGGAFADFDRFGGVRGSNLSPFPSVQQGYFDYRYDTTIPGRTVSQFGGGPAPQVILQVTAMDAKSIVDRHQEIGDALLRAIDHGHVGLSERLHGN